MAAAQPKCPHGNSGQFGCTHCTLAALQLKARVCAWCRRPEAYGYGIGGLCGLCSRAAAQGHGPKFARDVRLHRVGDIFPIGSFESAHSIMRKLREIDAKERDMHRLVQEGKPLCCTKCRLPFRPALYPWPFGLCPRPACGPASEPPNVRHKL